MSLNHLNIDTKGEDNKMNLDTQYNRKSLISYLNFGYIRYSENILTEYQNVLDVSTSMNNENLRLCEQNLIKLGKKELQDSLKEFMINNSNPFILQENNELSVLLHLIHVFCIPHQEEKIKLVQVNLSKVLNTNTEQERYHIFERYLSQQLKAKSILTDKDLLTGQIDPQHEFRLKLCYWKILCAKNYTRGCKEFLKKNADFLVSNIQKVNLSMKLLIPLRMVRQQANETLFCTLLLCLLNWNVCETKAPVTFQNKETPASSSVVFEACTSTNYSFPAYKVSNILQKILSTLSEHDIFKTFNNYLEQMYAMKSGITEDDFCTGKIHPYHEFLLKLCYCEKLCNKRDDDNYRKFLKRNADFLVPQIKEMVDGNKIKFKLISCKILLCLVQMTTQNPSILQNTELQASPSVILVANTPTKSSCPANTIRSILQRLFSVLSEDEIFTVLNNYLEQMYAINSEITDEDLCTGKIEPYHEFLLKLCYCEKLCNKRDDKMFKEFLRRNVVLFVPQIEKVIQGNNREIKCASCKVLLCLLNWNICNQKSTFTQSKITEKKSSKLQESCSFQSEVEDTTKKSCTMYKVRCVLQKLLSTLVDNDISKVFNGYIYHMCTMKSEITPSGLCIGVTDSHHELQLKLCFWETICRKNDYESYKKFIQMYPEVLVSHIKKRIVLCQGTKTKPFYCRILLCILNWNICTSKTAPLLVQKAEIQTSSSIAIVADSPPKYSYTAETIRNILQQLLSTFSEEEIFTLFNNYIDILYAMNSEITEAGFCTGKIEPFHEFLFKLCFCEKQSNEDDNENYRKFLRRNADFLVSQIEEVVDRKNTKTKVISCKVLWCLLKWDICSGKTAHTRLKNILSQMLSQKAVCQDFMYENALLFVSMVRTVIKRNNIPLLINLCDVLLCIPYNECHFRDVTGAINKLIRYYAKHVAIDEKICEWIILLGHRLLKYTKHTKDIDNHTAAEEIHYDFQMFINFLGDLFTEAIPVGTTFDLLINAFRKETYIHDDYEKKDCDICYDKLQAKFCKKKKTDDKHLNELWRAKLTCKVKSIQFSNYIRKKRKNLHFKIDENKTSNNNGLEWVFAKTHLNFIDAFEAEVKEDQLKVQTLVDQIKAILINDEMVKKFQLSKMLVLLMVLLIAGTSTGHHKSAKLKKYLTLKYEYDKASLYLLWCSGDIEVHPGPSLNKRSLAHDSIIKRRWIQNISPKILVLLPEHEQSKYKQTKTARNDEENRKHFEALLKTCQEEKVHVPKMYLAEINAWETEENQLLHKLFVYRCEIETIITSLQDFFTCGGILNDLTDINVSFDTELKANEIEMVLGKDQRPEDKSQLIVYITRHIAGILIKCAHGKAHDTKFDGLWDLPLKNWPKDIILFDPNNRGKYSKKYPGQKLISDQKLVDNLIALQQVTIPRKYTDIVDAYKVMRTNINKQHKEGLCNIFKKITSLEKIDYSLRNLCENGIFTEEVHNILSKWWTTRAVETGDDQKLSQKIIDDGEKRGRPHISINISTTFISITVDPTIESSSHVKYDFPFNDDLVPLKTTATAVNQITKQLPSSDLKTPDANPADNQTNSSLISQEAMDILNSFISVDPNGHVTLTREIKLQSKTSTQDPASRSMTHLDQSISPTFQFSQSNTQTAVSGQLVSITSASDQSIIYADDHGNSTLNVSQNQSSSMGFPGSTTFISSEVVLNSGHQFNTVIKGKQLLTDSDNSSDNGSNTRIKPTIGSKRKRKKSTEEDINGDQLRDSKKSLLCTQMKDKKKPVLRPVNKQTETDQNQIVPLEDNSTVVNSNMNWLPDYQSNDYDSFNLTYLSADEILTWI